MKGKSKETPSLFLADLFNEWERSHQKSQHWCFSKPSRMGHSYLCKQTPSKLTDNYSPGGDDSQV